MPSLFKPMRVKRSTMIARSVASAFEPLESRRLLSAWNWAAQYIHQDEAVSDFPSITGAGQSVAVLDTGAYVANPSLTGKNIIFKDFYGNSSTPVDVIGHGTAVASQIVGNPVTFTSTGTFGQGVAPGAQLIVLRTDDESASTSWGTEAQRISNALNWVIANKTKYNITAINLSTGGDAGFTDTALTGDDFPTIDQTLEGQFATLAGMGVFIAAASGNDGGTMPNTVEYPAADPNVVSVGSINSSGQASSFSSGGVLNDLLAPGEDVPVAYSTSSQRLDSLASGTSFSVTQVVGAALLIRQVDPSFTNAQILQILKDSGTPTNDAYSGNTFPVINIDAAIRLAYSESGGVSVGNHTAATATAIGISGGLGSVSSQTLTANSPDFYSFTLTQSQAVVFTPIYGSGDSPTATLLSQQGSTLLSIPSTGANTQLSAGTYFIKFASSTTLNNTFGLTLAISSPVVTVNTPPGGNATAVKIAYDPYGRLDMAWYDGTSQSLKFAMRNADGTWNATVVVDSSSQAGSQLSLAIDPYGLPGIAYYNQGAGTLKYAHFNGTGWSTATVDSTGITGWQPSLVYTSAAKPYIAYFMASGLRLKVATASGSKWSITTVDSGGNVGFVPSIAYDKNTGRIAVAYEDLARSQYKYAYLSGSKWTKQIVDTTTHAAGGTISLVFDASDHPTMVYNDAYTLALKYAHSNGSTWSVEQVDGSSGFGENGNLSIDTSGNASVYYYNVYAGAIDLATRDTSGVWSNSPITGGGLGLNEALGGQGQTALTWLTGGNAVVTNV